MAAIGKNFRRLIDRRVVYRSDEAFIKRLDEAIARSRDEDFVELLELARRHAGPMVGVALAERWDALRNAALALNQADEVTQSVALTLYEMSARAPSLRTSAIEAIDAMLSDPITPAGAAKQIRVYRHLLDRAEQGAGASAQKPDASAAQRAADAADPIAQERKALARSVAEAALLRGRFTLRSGRTSNYYLDKYLFSTRPDLLRQIARHLAQRIVALDQPAGTIDRLAGAELGGVPLVTAVSLETGLPSLFVRNAKKSYGTSKRLEGKLEEGEKVILIEDVSTSGGQAIEAVEAIRDAGAEVAAVLTVIDRQEGARENVPRQARVRFEALFTKEDLGVREE